ncbi:MAG: hypothetical protein KIT72_04740 [Polyangiaceae bacterium]|nr:hypothetical protein [Polyangiaceae bacterium]MCW5789711.1 hypothetical protein [Polyangiaceae bacterium]
MHGSREAPSGAASQALADDIAARGYGVVPALLGERDLATARAAVERVVTQLAPPSFYSASPLPIEHPEVPGPIEVTSVGLTMQRVHAAAPELAPLVLQPRSLEPIRTALGDAMQLEVLGAVVSDEVRPFFTWHTHIDREHEGARIRAGKWPDKPRVERVLMLVYLDHLDDDSGQLLVYPRAAGEPTAPPYRIEAESWPGEVALSLRAGDAVILEQCTWHAARPRQTAGRRSFIACYFASNDASHVEPTEPSLRSLMQ